MKKKTSLFTLSFILVGGFVYYSTSDKANNEPQQAPAISPVVHLTAPSTEGVAAPTKAAPSVPSKKSNEPLKNKIEKYKIGKGADYRAELEKNPHQTPDVAIASALELGEIFDGVKNETDAGQAFGFFANCVAIETVVSLQTSCLRYAKRLSENYSSIRALWPSLEASASREVKDVLKFDQRK